LFSSDLFCFVLTSAPIVWRARCVSFSLRLNSVRFDFGALDFAFHFLIALHRAACRHECTAAAVAESSRADSNVALLPVCSRQERLSASNPRSDHRATLPIRTEKNLNAECLTGHGHGGALNRRQLRHTSRMLIGNSSGKFRM
jgi:hypothetical protein